MTTYFNLVVTCCEHANNCYNDIPGAVWADSWADDSIVRDPVLWISQVVPVGEGERLRYHDDREPVVDGSGRPIRDRVLRDQDGTPVRNRISESCARCGQPLRMRDDTWNQLSRRLEGLGGLWREEPTWDVPGPWDRMLYGDISLPVLARLAEEMRRVRGQSGR